MISRWNIRSGGGRVGSVVHGANSAIASDISAQGDRLKQREFLGVLAGATSAWPGFAFAHQNQPPKRVGLLANLPLQPIQKFRQKLQALGWVEGKNLIIEYRYGEGRDDRFPELAAELVSMPVDVLVVGETPRHLPPSMPPPPFRS